MAECPPEIMRFITNLLETEPGAQCSIQLAIDTGGDDTAAFEVYLLIMTEILKCWYSPPIKLSNVSKTKLSRLVRYFASFGIEFNLDIRLIPAVLHIDNRAYLNVSELKDMKFKMSADGKLYTVSFGKIQ